VALALVNTEVVVRDSVEDLLPDADAVRRFLTMHELPVPSGLGPGDVEAVGRLRAAVRATFLARASGTPPPPEALAELNTTTVAAPRAPQIDWRPDGWTRTWRDTTATLDGSRAVLAADAIEVVAGRHGPALRLCEAHGCQRFFLQDHGRRRWCSTRCGDRVRVARHYAKTHPDLHDR